MSVSGFRSRLLFVFHTQLTEKLLDYCSGFGTLFSWKMMGWKKASRLFVCKCYALSSYPSYFGLCTARSTCIAFREFSMHVLLFFSTSSSSSSSLRWFGRSLVRLSCIHSLVLTINMWTFVPYTRSPMEWIYSEEKKKEKESERAWIVVVLFFLFHISK